MEENKNIDDKAYCKVTIFGDIYRLISDEYSFDRLKITANEVDKQMRMIAEKYPGFSKYKIAILVALNVMDTLLKSNKETMLPSKSTKTDFDDDISREALRMRIEKLINDLDEVI